jgi:hypothetical protein
MMAFTANSADDGRLATVPRGCIDFCSFPERNVSIACHGCHAAGLLPIEDTMLGVTPSALRERIGGLPELAALADPSATIPRSTLVEGSSRALCALGMRNRPATCP